MPGPPTPTSIAPKKFSLSNHPNPPFKVLGTDLDAWNLVNVVPTTNGPYTWVVNSYNATPNFVLIHADPSPALAAAKAKPPSRFTTDDLTVTLSYEEPATGAITDVEVTCPDAEYDP